MANPVLVVVWGGTVVWAAACVAMAWRFPQDVYAAGDDAWRRALEDELSSVGDDRERVFLVNEALDDVEASLTQRKRWPEVATWLSFGGASMIMAAAATHRLDPGLLGALPVALLGAGLCQLAARRGTERARIVRREVDRTVDEVCGDLVGVEVVLPERGHRRSRRRRSP